MQAEKISVSLPMSLVQFIKNYKTAHHYKSRSLVIQEALELLQQRELETAYQQASQEADSDWDVTVADGLTDESGEIYFTHVTNSDPPSSNL